MVELFQFIYFFDQLNKIIKIQTKYIIRGIIQFSPVTTNLQYFKHNNRFIHSLTFFTPNLISIDTYSRKVFILLCPAGANRPVKDYVQYYWGLCHTVLSVCVLTFCVLM